MLSEGVCESLTDDFSSTFKRSCDCFKFQCVTMRVEWETDRMHSEKRSGADRLSGRVCPSGRCETGGRVSRVRSERGSGSHVLQSTGETISLGHFHWSVQEWQIEGMSAGDVCIFNVCPGNFPFFVGGDFFLFDIWWGEVVIKEL